MEIRNSNNPLTLVVFGATGDLYQNKLSLALFNLFSLNLLPSEFGVVGFARKPLTDLDFCNFTREAVTKKSKKYNKEKFDKFLSHFKYIQGNLENLLDFKILGKQLAKDDEKLGICSNKLFYLAVPPSLYASIFKNISNSGLTVPCAPGTKNRPARNATPARNAVSTAGWHSVAGGEEAWTRVLVEKPFGKDIKEAKHLDKMLGGLFDETQIFRIDHYLAKETMQNLLTFRFSNAVFESIWSNKNIERVRVIFHEENTVASRGSFYDGIGALRDVGQNHMLAMLALIAMENPKMAEGEKIHNARAAVLEKIKLYEKSIIARGQYKGYLKELKVGPKSKTETFFRVVLGINNEKWRGVRFEMEGGKALAKAEVFIEVNFKNSNAFLTFPISSHKIVPYDAYEKVFYNCILGDQTLFTSTKEIMAQWKIVTDIIKKWQATPLVIYKKGSLAKDIK